MEEPLRDDFVNKCITENINILNDLNCKSAHLEVIVISRKWVKILKSIMLLSAIIVYVLVGITVGYTPSDSYSIIHDPIMYDWLGWLNDVLNSNKTISKMLKILSSLIVDITVLSTFIYWLDSVHNGRLFYSLVVFFTARAIA